MFQHANNPARCSGATPKGCCTTCTTSAGSAVAPKLHHLHHQPGDGTLAGIVAAAIKAGNCWQQDNHTFLVRLSDYVTLRLTATTIAEVGALWADRAKWQSKPDSTTKRQRRSRPLPAWRARA